MTKKNPEPVRFGTGKKSSRLAPSQIHSAVPNWAALAADAAATCMDVNLIFLNMVGIIPLMNYTKRFQASCAHLNRVSISTS